MANKTFKQIRKGSILYHVSSHRHINVFEKDMFGNYTTVEDIMANKPRMVEKKVDYVERERTQCGDFDKLIHFEDGTRIRIYPWTLNKTNDFSYFTSKEEAEERFKVCLKEHVENYKEQMEKLNRAIELLNAYEETL